MSDNIVFKRKSGSILEFGKKMKKLRKTAKKLGIRVTTKRNGKRVDKPESVLSKQIRSNMRKKVIGKQRKSLPFLKDIRKNRMSFGKKMKKLRKTAKKLGIRVTTKRNGKRVDKPESVLSKQIAMRKKVIGKQRKSLPFLKDIRKNRMSDKMGMYFGGGTEALMVPKNILSSSTKQILSSKKNKPLLRITKKHGDMASEYKKVLFLGDRGVGKTSIINKIMLDEFFPTVATLGMEVHSVNFYCGEDDPQLPQTIIKTNIYEYAGGNNMEINYEDTYAVFIFYRNNLAGANLYLQSVPANINRVFLIHTTNNNINIDNPSGITVSAEHSTSEQLKSLFCNLLA